MNDKKRFGLYLAKLRERQGFNSQRKLALATKISPATISRIEAGIQKAEPETLKKLAPYLGVPVEVLMEKAGYLDNELLKNYSSEKDLVFVLRESNVKYLDKPLDEEDKKDVKNFLEMIMKRKPGSSPSGGGEERKEGP